MQYIFDSKSMRVLLVYRKHTHLQESPLFNGEALEQECNDEEPSESEFWLTGRSTYLRIDLDIILHNIRILKERCSPETGTDAHVL